MQEPSPSLARCPFCHVSLCVCLSGTFPRELPSSRHDQGRGRTLTRLVSFIGVKASHFTFVTQVTSLSFERKIFYNKDHQPGRRFAYVFAKEQRF